MTREEEDQQYTNFKVTCERLRHSLDVMEEKLNRLDEIESQKGLFTRLMTFTRRTA
jgi:phage shock protein A